MTKITEYQVDLLLALRSLGDESDSVHIGLKLWEMRGGKISPSWFIKNLRQLEENGVLQRNRGFLPNTFSLTSQGEQALTITLTKRQRK